MEPPNQRGVHHKHIGETAHPPSRNFITTGGGRRNSFWGSILSSIKKIAPCVENRGIGQLVFPSDWNQLARPSTPRGGVQRNTHLPPPLLSLLGIQPLNNPCLPPGTNGVAIACTPRRKSPSGCRHRPLPRQNDGRIYQRQEKQKKYGIFLHRNRTDCLYMDHAEI